jgi:hypothetical protein
MCIGYVSIWKIRFDADRVTEANAERLGQEFTEIKFKLGESVEDFSLHIMALVNGLWVLADKEVVKKMLHSVPEKMEQMAISMEILLNLNSLSI